MYVDYMYMYVLQTSTLHDDNDAGRGLAAQLFTTKHGMKVDVMKIPIPVHVTDTRRPLQDEVSE